MDNRSMFGLLLEQVMRKRKSLRDEAVRDLHKRAGISPGTPGYKLEESKSRNIQGVEVTEYRLYKLVDCAVTHLRANAEAKIETGLAAINEKLR